MEMFCRLMTVKTIYKLTLHNQLYMCTGRGCYAIIG